MIEFDYEIIRNEGDEEKKFIPLIPKQLQDLVYIEGPNSSGKSTILNIIALGLYGQKNKSIKDSLQRKLSDLIQSNHQKITFTFTIKNDLLGLQIISEKKNPNTQQIDVYELVDGKKTTLTFDQFERKYNLIYDIPDNPLERFDELTRELKDKQTKIGRRVGELVFILKEIIKEIRLSKDPDKLEKMRQELIDVDNKIKNLEKDKSNLENDLLAIKKYYYSKFYIETSSRYDEIIRNIDKLEEEIKGFEKKEKEIKRKNKTLTKGAKDLIDSIQKEITEIYTSFNRMNIKMKENYVEIWRDLDLQETFIKYENHYLLFDGIKAFKEKLTYLVQQLQSDSKVEEAQFLNELILVLNHYIHINVTIPGVDKTIPEFISIIEKKYNECKDIKTNHDKYLKLINILDDLEKKCNFFINQYLPELLELIKEQSKSKDDSDISHKVEKIENYKKDLEYLISKKQYYRDELIKLGVKENESEINEIIEQYEKLDEFKFFTSFDENQFEDKITHTEKLISAKILEINKSINNKTRIEIEINRLEKQEPHKYQKYLNILEDLLKKTQLLEQKLLNEFYEHLEKLINKKITKDEIGKHPKNKTYFDAIAKFLARKIGTIRHIDQEYQVHTIDLVERKIHADSGKVIYFTDLGTGQSQSAYLKGLLSSNDNRKIIALIDEVAMMDSKSMKPILDLLKQKYYDGSLVAAIVVQKGESIKVIEIH